MTAILVTGGAGFIGSHTADALVARGRRVRILDSLEERVHPGGAPPYLPKPAELIVGDVRLREDWLRALRGVEVVIHLAAYQDYMCDYSRFFDVNCVGTALLYELVVEQRLPVRRIIVASSQAVYGEGRYRCPRDGVIYPGPRDQARLARGAWDIPCPACGGGMAPAATDESRANPQNPYAVSKHAQERLALNLGRAHGIPTVALRYSIVQGPRQSPHNVYSGACRVFALTLLCGRAPILFEDGEQLRDYVHIDDVVAANLRVLEDSRADYEVFNVGGDRPHTVKELYRAVAEAVGSSVRPRVPGEYRAGDTRHILSDTTKLRVLGWSPTRTLAQNVESYIRWLQAQGGDPVRLEAGERAMREAGVIRGGDGDTSHPVGGRSC
ncbi:MAG: NAD-dependent epimerase/dehydratase family protein [Chloroflexi bacterium]|nr:NAD-dependent epimerase/dehydratase family protein [Chloroflexota bacterium]